MKIVLKNVRKKTPFTWINPIKVEPLALEYLQSVLDEMAVESIIVDEWFTSSTDRGDIVVLNGYNTARDQMIKDAQKIKKHSPETLIIGSGVDVQVNYDLYKNKAFDYLITSNSLKVFEQLIRNLMDKKIPTIPGVLCFPYDTEMLSEPLTAYEEIQPNRQFFHNYKNETYYLLYDQVALVKKSMSCPYQCEFCFCKKLNGGHYIASSFEALYEEVKMIQSQYIWAVDDVFLSSRDEAEAFIEVFSKTTYQWIIYLRADFVVKYPDLMKELKACGVVEVIIGFESINDETLNNFKKGYSADANAHAIDILNKVGLSFTALFMVHVHDTYKDFRALKQYIKCHDIKQYTFSMFTPLRGTDIYTQYEQDIVDFKCHHYDFLHMVMKPTQMHSLTYQWAFYSLFVFQFFHSQIARKIVYKAIKNIFKKRLR